MRSPPTITNLSKDVPNLAGIVLLPASRLEEIRELSPLNINNILLGLESPYNTNNVSIGSSILLLPIPATI